MQTQAQPQALSNLWCAIVERYTTQARFAAKVRISRTILSEIVRGKRLADPLLRRKIAKALDAPEPWLFATPTIPSDEEGEKP
jgi:transcriptional regulator with XRE-family HTH domain